MTRKLPLLTIVLLTASLCSGATINFSGSLTGYTTIGGSADPLGLGLPESFRLNLVTSGTSIVSGSLAFTGGSGKNYTLTGGTIANAGTTAFSSIVINESPGGSLTLSFSDVIPDFTQAGLDTLFTKTGTVTLSGFPFQNGAQGLYQGSVTVLTPEPATASVALLSLTGLLAAGWRKRAIHQR